MVIATYLSSKESNIAREILAENYGVDKIDINTFPLKYQTIYKYQQKIKNLVEKPRRANYHTKYFCWVGNEFMLIC